MNSPLHALSHGAKLKPFCCLLGNSFALPHPPIGTFVANKRQSAIRQDCDRAVRSPFSVFFAFESRLLFSPHHNREIYCLVKQLAKLKCQPRISRTSFCKSSCQRSTDIRGLGRDVQTLYRFLFAACKEKSAHANRWALASDGTGENRFFFCRLSQETTQERARPRRVNSEIMRFSAGGSVSFPRKTVYLFANTLPDHSSSRNGRRGSIRLERGCRMCAAGLDLAY